MWQRCTNQRNASFRHYGGRGIRVCKRWKSFTAFIADMGPRPSPHHSLDRRNNDGDYSPKNCRWATPEEQQSNTRNNRKVTALGETLIMSEWSRRSGIPLATLWRRLVTWEWDPERAVTEPLRESVET